MSAQTPSLTSTYTDIIEEVAARDGVSPLDLPPFYHSVDAGIRDSLTPPDPDPGPAMFTYCGYDVIVDGEGHVTVAGGD